MRNQLEELEEILQERGILRVGELAPMGFPPSYLSELEKRGKAVKQARGVYMHHEADIPPHYSLALAYHEIGTQNPQEVWLAIDRKDKAPIIDYPPLRLLRFSGDALSEGIQTTTGGTQMGSCRYVCNREKNPLQHSGQPFRYFC